MGFDILRVRGSHHYLKHSDGRITVVPLHGNDSIGPGLLTRVLRDCGCSAEELARNL
ncbi:MAG: type II toxin-antitoxin system HicA family toxin [Bryobacter sp.]|nr:type II toxin-antitoxin system HicA family toxin [Bryobacter sp.]